MKFILFLSCIGLLAAGCRRHCPTDLDRDRQALIKTKEAMREAFDKGDVAGVLLLHSPAIVKDFGGSNVIRGRDALAKQLNDWFGANRVEFLDNKVENTIFCGETIVETSIFKIRSTPKNGRPPFITRGRSMVVFSRDKGSPTGWVALREMTQEAPPEK